MAGPNKLSAHEIAGAASKSVADILAKRKLQVQPDFPLGFVKPPWWWVGIVIRNPGLTTIEQAEALATEIHTSVAATAPAARGATPGCVLQGGNLTIGFVPPEPINLLEG